MKERKHIDRLYQEKFKDFEVSPREAVWKNISERIQQKKKKKIFPWKRIAGAAAMLALLFSLGDQFSTANNAVVDIEEKPFKVPKKNPFPPSSGIVIKTGSNIKTEDSTAVNHSAINESKRQSNSERINNEEHIAEVSALNLTSFQLSKRTHKFNDAKDLMLVSSSEIVSTTRSAKKINPLFELEKQKKEALREIPNTKNNKLKIRAFAAPIYYNGFGSSSIDPALANNKKEGEVTMSYGMSFAYAVSDKIKIRSGVSKVAMSYNTMDIVYGASANPTILRNVDYAASNPHLTIENASGPSISNIYSELDGFPSSTNEGFINQSLGFIEVPLEVEFVLIDHKFGLNVIGGASTLILNENSISIHSGNISSNLGESNNLNPVSFSTNIGLGVDYKLSQKFQINIEPMFKYQFNTFSSGNLKPYYLGVYSGVSYKF